MVVCALCRCIATGSMRLWTLHYTHYAGRNSCILQHLHCLSDNLSTSPICQLLQSAMATNNHNNCIAQLCHNPTVLLHAENTKNRMTTEKHGLVEDNIFMCLQLLHNLPKKITVQNG